MEKYGQYRDKGSGIAPFFPVPPSSSNALLLPWYMFLFCIRLPLVTFAWFVWLTIVQWTPAGGVLRKANLWCVLGIPGVWWIDLQVDGVRRGSLSQTPRGKLPLPGHIIASSYTSPLDILYLAAIFDPIFTKSEPGSRLIRPVTIEAALAACFDLRPPPPFNVPSEAIELSQFVQENHGRVIVVFPETTTSNGRGILKLSPSLLSAASDTKIFPVSLRYTPPDVVTPIPGWIEAAKFIWRLNSRPTHCIRVRVGAPLMVSTPPPVSYTTSYDTPPSKNLRNSSSRRNSTGKNGFESNFFDTLDTSSTEKVAGDNEGDDSQDEMTEPERRVLDAVADTLARLGRVKRVGLGVEEKNKFVEAWVKGRGARRRIGKSG